MKKQYSDRQTIIYQLTRKRLKPKPNANNPKYFEAFKGNNQIGLKSLGRLDFLKCSVRFVERKNKPKSNMTNHNHKSCCICKQTATTHRYYDGDWFELCDNPKCDRHWRDKQGLTLGI